MIFAETLSRGRGHTLLSFLISIEKYALRMVRIDTASRKGSSPGEQTRKILIVRHAESTANVKGLLAGRIDPTPLTGSGRTAAKGLAPIIADFNPEKILVSPMLRCRQTIEEAGASEFEIDDRLIEMDYGKWSGSPLKVLSKRKDWKRIQGDPANFRFPNGESFEEAWKRISDLLGQIALEKHERLVLVTHGDITRMIITHLLDNQLNSFQRILIEPASHSMLITTAENQATIGYLNRLPGAIHKGRSTDQKRNSYQVGGE
jgi:broad specificity phosphatase PhoE